MQGASLPLTSNSLKNSSDISFLDNRGTQLQVIDHTWDTENRILCTLSDKTLHYIDPNSPPQFIQTVHFEEQIFPKHLSLTKTHIIVSTEVRFEYNE